jgi:hypothetical protein
MRILTTRTLYISLLLSVLGSGSSFAQATEVTVSQDPRFEELLAEKRKISSSITVNDRYKVQIFYGENDKARKALQDFKRDFKGQDGTIIFESPTYKVWVGSYKTRIEAEKNLEDIRRKFPHALLVKPNK